MEAINPMLLCDYYKTTHMAQFPEGTTELTSYFTPRMSRLNGVNGVVVFGLQAFCKEYLIDYFNKHFFGRPLNEVADEYVKMALLLHDVGKPISKTTDENGHDHFYGHAKFSAKIAEQILRRLRYSNQFIDTVVELISNHDVEFVPTKPCARRLLNRLGVDQVHRLLKMRECDNRAHTQDAFVKFDNMTVPFSKILEEVLQEEGTLKIKNLSINGTDIIHLGCNEGPMIGKTLAHLLDLVVDGSISNDRESLIKESKDFLGI